MPKIEDSHLIVSQEKLDAEGYIRVPPPEQGPLNIPPPPPDFRTPLSSSPGNPSPLRSMLPLNIMPEMYTQRHYPDAPHFERSFPISNVTAQYNAAQALTMQAASVSSSRALVRPQSLDELVDLNTAGMPTKTLGYIGDSANRKAATAATLSYRPLSNPLTATDAGVTATVTIANFTMRVAGIGDLSVTGGSIPTLAFSTLYFIYYDDPDFAGGTVTFNATTVKENVLNNAGRFFTGSILTPADGAADTIGNNDGGVGAQFGYTFSSLATQYEHLEVSHAGWPTYAFDGVLTSCAVLLAHNVDPCGLDIFAYSNSQLPANQIKLRIYSKHTHTGGTVATGIIRYSTDGRASWTDVRNSTSDWDASVVPDEVTITGVLLASIAVEAYALQSGAGHRL